MVIKGNLWIPGAGNQLWIAKCEGYPPNASRYLKALQYRTFSTLLKTLVRPPQKCIAEAFRGQMSIKRSWATRHPLYFVPWMQSISEWKHTDCFHIESLNWRWVETFLIASYDNVGTSSFNLKGALDYNAFFRSADIGWHRSTCVCCCLVWCFMGLIKATLQELQHWWCQAFMFRQELCVIIVCTVGFNV